MKTQVGYGLFIFTLGIFGSCAEPFREMGTRRSDFYVNHSTPKGNAYAFNPSSIRKSGSGFQKIPRDTVHVAEESSLCANQHIGTAQSNFTFTDKNGEMSLMSEQTLGVAIPEKTVVVPKKGATRLATSFLKQLHSAPSSLNRSTRITQKSDKSKGKSHSRYGEPINGFLIALGVLGLIISLLGLLVLGFAAFWGERELVFWSSYPIIIDILIFLLGFISSIGLLVNPRFEDSNPLKIVMVILATLPIIVLFLLILPSLSAY